MEGSSGAKKRFLTFTVDLDEMAKPMLYDESDRTNAPGEKKVKLQSFYSSLQALATGLKFSSTKDLEEWMNSGLFQDHWKIYKTECLNPRKEQAALQGHQISTGENFRKVYAAIRKGEANVNIRCSNSFPNKIGWKSIDHAAYFLYWNTYLNLNHRDGALYRKDFLPEAAHHAIWQVREYDTQRSQPSKQESNITSQGSKRIGDIDPDQYPSTVTDNLRTRKSKHWARICENAGR